LAEAFVKGPNDKVMLSHDFTNELAAAEMITTVNTYTIAPSGCTVHGTPDHDSAGKKVLAQISGGTADTTYTITVKVTTDTGSPDNNVLERVWPLRVRTL